MRQGFPWRPVLLALAVLVGSAGGVLAHALPGSVLLLRQQEDGLRLTIRFPLEDLVIAAPELAVLEEVTPGDPLPQEMAERFGGYLLEHMELTGADGVLPLTLAGAMVQPAYHDHLGHFLLVVSEWNVAGGAGGNAHLVLNYDAVMHEVRSHRATVQWIARDGETRPVAEFGYHGADGGVRLNLSGF
ncbi:hypothetical protein [Amaricoccus tamworthensis]|uniref:hypothetical protein n=1 Tax=Amaricoccus tamworthensis TaxID=57002 RepID=UPI003C79A12A